VTNTIPSTSSYKFATPYSEGVQSFAVWKPWLDSTDTQCIFFARYGGSTGAVPGCTSASAECELLVRCCELLLACSTARGNFSSRF
jgi:hypothetical protein